MTGRWPRAVVEGGAREGERGRDPLFDLDREWLAGDLLHHSAEQPEAHVRVARALPWLEQRGAAGNQAHHLVDRVRVLQVAEQQRLLFGSRDVVRAGPVLEQQLDGDPIRVGNIGVPLVERVVESQATLVDQRQHDRRRERLRHAAHTEHLVGGHRLPGGRVRHPARQQHVVVAGHADRHGGARHAGGGHQCVELRLQLVGDCGRVHRHGVVDGFRLGLGRRRLHRRLHALGGRE